MIVLNYEDFKMKNIIFCSIFSYVYILAIVIYTYIKLLRYKNFIGLLLFMEIWKPGIVREFKLREIRELRILYNWVWIIWFSFWKFWKITEFSNTKRVAIIIYSCKCMYIILCIGSNTYYLSSAAKAMYGQRIDLKKKKKNLYFKTCCHYKSKVHSPSKEIIVGFPQNR